MPLTKRNTRFGEVVVWEPSGAGCRGTGPRAALWPGACLSLCARPADTETSADPGHRPGGISVGRSSAKASAHPGHWAPGVVELSSPTQALGSVGRGARLLRQSASSGSG